MRQLFFDSVAFKIFETCIDKRTGVVFLFLVLLLGHLDPTFGQPNRGNPVSMGGAVWKKTKSSRKEPQKCESEDLVVDAPRKPFQNSAKPFVRKFGYLTADQVVQAVQENDLRSVEQTLFFLKRNYPKIFDIYLLMHRSRSVQESSFQAPRALLFSPGGDFVLAFNGSKEQRGFHRIEMMEFIPEEHRFEFQEISFAKNLSLRAKPSEKNPTACLRCHQSPFRANVDPRPNWEPYSLWPGAYGTEDALGGKIAVGRAFRGEGFDNRINSERETRIVRKADQKMVAEHVDSVRQLANFEKYIKPFNSRYRLLNGKYKPGITADVTELFTQFNARRVLRNIKELGSRLEPYKYAFLGILKCRDNGEPQMIWPFEFENFHRAHLPISERIRDPNSGGKFLRLSKERNGYYEKFKKDVAERKYQRVIAGQEFSTRYFTEALVLLFEPLGVNTSDWSMDFQTNGGRFARSERFGAPSNTVRIFENAFRYIFPELSRVSCQGTCAKKAVAKKSSEALKKFKKENGFEKSKMHLAVRAQEESNYKLIKHCSSCHEDPDLAGVVIPFIPFSDKGRLAKALTKEGFARGTLREEILYRIGSHASAFERMPPNLMVPPKKMREFRRLIEEL